jgi:hypothetical protein
MAGMIEGILRNDTIICSCRQLPQFKNRLNESNMASVSKVGPNLIVKVLDPKSS